jgi:hypothetical protein
MLKDNTRRFNKNNRGPPPNASIWNRSSANAKANVNVKAKAKANANNISRKINNAARNRRLAAMRLPPPSYPMVVRQRIIPTKPALSGPQGIIRYQQNKKVRNSRKLMNLRKLENSKQTRNTPVYTYTSEKVLSRTQILMPWRRN